MDWIEESAKDRANIKQEHPELFNKICHVLFIHDPMNINYETNPDEYEPETGTIISNLKNCSSTYDVRKMVYKEFVRWFYDDVGNESDYTKIAEEIWIIWETYKNQRRQFVADQT